MNSRISKLTRFAAIVSMLTAALSFNAFAATTAYAAPTETSMNLSKNFTLAEMEYSVTATRDGIDNRVSTTAAHPDLVIGNLTRLCGEILQPARDEHGPVITDSGYRCLELNRHIRSGDTSQHITGQASDVRVVGLAPEMVCRWIEKSGLAFDQLIYEVRWTHVSVAAEGKPPRGEVLTAVFTPGQPTRYISGIVVA